MTSKSFPRPPDIPIRECCSNVRAHRIGHHAFASRIGRTQELNHVSGRDSVGILIIAKEG
jgi:hypothetical protein